MFHFYQFIKMKNTILFMLNLYKMKLKDKITFIFKDWEILVIY